MMVLLLLQTILIGVLVIALCWVIDEPKQGRSSAELALWQIEQTLQKSREDMVQAIYEAHQHSSRRLAVLESFRSKP